MRSLLLALLALLVLSQAAAAQTIDWIEWDPMAIRSTRTDAVPLVLQSTNIVSIRLDLAAGGSIALTNAGGGRFTGSVSAAAALFDYQADDVNTNFVGFLHVFGPGSVDGGAYNLFIGVLDGRVPAVAVTNLPNNARRSARILNLYRPAFGEDVQQAANAFYSYLPDRFDFLQVAFTLPTYFQNRYHFQVTNDVTGIGLPILHNASAFGSAGHLLGISVFPDDTYFDCAASAFSHELGHQWINFSKNPAVQPGPHWPLSTMAHGVMGFNIAGTNVGGQYPWALQPQGNGTYKFVAEQTTREFSDFDLYLMGLMPAREVTPGLVLANQTQTPCNGCVVQGAVISVPVDALIAADGPRSPAAAWPKLFHVATVVVTRDRPLTDDELAYFDYFAARGEATGPLPFAGGFERGTTKPFFLATRTRASVDLLLDPAPKRRHAIRH